MAKFKWVVEIEIDETWVQDGFDIENNDSMADMIRASRLGYAYSHEVKSKVLKRPPNKLVATAMGYKKVKDYLAQRNK